MTSRVVAWLMATAVVIYMAFALWRAWLLIQTGQPMAIALALAIVLIPAVGAWLLWRELAFGFRMQLMGRTLAAQGQLPVDDLPRAPSGRPDRAAADARFMDRQAEVEAAPADWRAWYRLALAYDDARDRKRARAAMRQASALFTPTL